MVISKTNAMRILDNGNIHYGMLAYDNKDGKIDGLSVAQKVDRNVEYVYKTLVTQGSSKDIYVFVIPVGEGLISKRQQKLLKKRKST